MRFTQKLEGLSGNGANGKMELRIPAGQKYFNLVIERTAGVLAITDLSRIKVLLGSDPIIDVTGEQLDAFNQEEGLAAYNGTTLVIPFELRGKMKETQDTRSTSLNIGVPSPTTGKAIVNAKLVLEIAAGAPTLDIYAELMPATKEGPGAIKRLREFTFVAPAGEGSITTLPFATNDTRFLSRMGLKTDGVATISGLRLFRNMNGQRDQIIERSKVINDALMVDGGRIPGTFYEMLLDWRNQGIMDMLDTAGFQALELKPTLSAGSDLSVVMEYVGGL